MATRMLIDASHEEETRVVIVKGTRLEEFDYETASRKQLKGNIYLAKVTRVEPSLQAAFVEYGGNRHGFLPFNEIHPDYYQVPISDREVLIEQEAAAEREASDLEEAEIDEKTVEAAQASSEKSDDEPEVMTDSETSVEEDEEDGVIDDADDTIGGLEVVDSDDDDIVENLGGEDDVDDRRASPPRRNYKIQEVIKRRQILLVQVVKEERGNKGAALTTYISLPGRYSVLMPNTGRGGGISRKISNPADRKRLKKIANELEVPDGIGVIIRTAGLSRTKVEIKRDYEFLMRLWDDIRELTLKSIAPYCVYEEANLIKRCIRDLYNKEVSEVLVEGDNGYKVAKDFMRKLMPSHAKKVQPYKDKIPLFHRFQVEQQFASMYNPEVQLKSGGYIVINPTEALVSIDVNSGKATRERNVEDTATKT
ncbi:MAG: ribonuclease E/G, partial [Sneathiella sp.]|uniref:Rne/Rng family ribonuclease n=1 Tax=Sneathiella sp. TaxID=1964365 RepID=UPI000C6B4E6C